MQSPPLICPSSDQAKTRTTPAADSAMAERLDYCSFPAVRVSYRYLRCNDTTEH